MELGWQHPKTHGTRLPILRPDNNSKNSGKRRAVWDVGYGSTSGYSPARAARITPETQAAAEGASQKSHSNLGYDRPETARLWAGRKEANARTANPTWANRAGKLCCCHGDKSNPHHQSLYVRIEQEHLYLITSLQSSAKHSGKRRKKREGERRVRGSTKQIWLRFNELLRESTRSRFLMQMFYWPYSQRRFESSVAQRQGSDTADPRQHANVTDSALAVVCNHTKLFEVSVSTAQFACGTKITCWGLHDSHRKNSVTLHYFYVSFCINWKHLNSAGATVRSPNC